MTNLEKLMEKREWNRAYDRLMPSERNVLLEAANDLYDKGMIDTLPSVLVSQAAWMMERLTERGLKQ